MPKLVFTYGAMGCSKTANALMTRFQYIEHNKNVLLIKPATDTRDDIISEDGTVSILIKSRVGINATAAPIKKDDDISLLYTLTKPDVIICDEAQFFAPEQIEQLKNISTYNCDVLCYGLRTDFKTKMFPGSKRLFELADEIKELDIVCDCGKKAIINARYNNKGEIIYEGAQVEIGGNERYKSVCWDCYRKGKICKEK